MKKQTKITKSARGEECTVRIPGVCTFRSDTVVLAHRPGGAMGGKNPDYQGAYCCVACHDAVDRRKESIYLYEEILVWYYEGVFRTQEILKNKGLIKVEEK